MQDANLPQLSSIKLPTFPFTFTVNLSCLLLNQDVVKSRSKSIEAIVTANSNESCLSKFLFFSNLVTLGNVTFFSKPFGKNFL